MTAKAAKTVKYGSSVDGISTVEPDQYAKRFLAFMDEAIEYLDFASHYERKKLWPTSKICRAVVTYRLDATVQRSIGYIAEEGEKLVIPNKLEITRQRNRIIEDIIDQC